MTPSISRFSHRRMSQDLVGGFIYVFMWSYVGFCWLTGSSDEPPMFNTIFLNDMVEVHQWSRYHWIHREKSFPSYFRGCMPLYWEPEYHLLSADSSLSSLLVQFVCFLCGRAKTSVRPAWGLGTKGLRITKRDDFPSTSYRYTKCFACLHAFSPSLYTSPHLGFLIRAHFRAHFREKKHNLRHILVLHCCTRPLC